MISATWLKRSYFIIMNAYAMSFIQDEDEINDVSILEFDIRAAIVFQLGIETISRNFKKLLDKNKTPR